MAGTRKMAISMCALGLHASVLVLAGAATDNGIFKGSGTSSYWSPIAYHSGDDGAVSVKVPTVAEFASAGMNVMEGMKHFSVSFHFTNVQTGGRLITLSPQGFDGSEGAEKTIEQCLISWHYPNGYNWYGNDCYLTGSACKTDNDGNRLYGKDYLIPATPTDYTVRNGVHVLWVQDGSMTHLYENGKHVMSRDYVAKGLSEIQPYLCFGGELRLEATGFFRDFRVYPRVLNELEISQIAESCDGSPEVLDDPSFGYDRGAKLSFSCMDYFTQLRNGLISTCPEDAKTHCLLSCTLLPVCAPPSRTEKIRALGLLDPSALCVNTDLVKIDELVDRCKTLSPFNDTWAAGEWPALGSNRRLGHIPNVVCPGLPDVAEVDNARDMRATYEPKCDFKGAALSSATQGDTYSFWWWDKRDDQPGIFSWYHRVAESSIAGNLKRSATYAYEFQDDKVWMSNLQSGEHIWKDIPIDYLQPAYIVDESTGKGRGRWVFKAFIFNGVNATFMIDGSYGNAEFKPDDAQLEALWVGHSLPVHGPTNFSDIKYTATALTIQQLQQIYHQESLSYLLCPPGQYHDPARGGSCSRCSVNTFSDSEGMTECKNCGGGYEAKAAASTNCTACRPGDFSIGGSACQPCEPGSAGSESAQSSCAVCTPGKYAASLGSLKCMDCPKGAFAPGIKERKCSICTPGKYATAPGTIECTLCATGKFQPETNSTSCTKCPGSNYITLQIGTASSDKCTCETGWYLNKKSNTCVECKALVGYTCPGGLDSPLVTDGFYALPVGDIHGSLMGANSFSEMSVWRCSVPGNCVGDRAMGACPPNMKGYGCSICEDGYAPSFDLLTCEECDGGGSAAFWIFIALLFPIVYLLATLNRNKYTPIVTERTLLVGLGSITVTFLQLVAIIVDLRPVWPGWFKSFGEDYAGIVMINTSFAKPSCSMGHSFVMRFLSNLTAPIVLIVVLFADAVSINMVFSKICPTLLPRLDLPDVANTVGVILQALFVMVSKSTFSYIECARNPSAPTTLIGYPDIECGSSEHKAALPLFISGLMFYVIGAWTYILWLNVKAMYLHNASPWKHHWRRALVFLVGKWKPAKWYWGQLYLTRNLLVSLVAVLEPDDGFYQTFLFMVFVLIPGSLTTLLQPWRHPINNQIDIITTPLIAFICVVGTPLVFVEGDVIQKSKDRANATIAFLVILSLLVLFSYFCCIVVEFARGKGAEFKETRRSEALMLALPTLTKVLNETNRKRTEGFKSFVAKLEPSDRTLIFQFCQLADQMLAKDAIKNALDSKPRDSNSKEPRLSRLSSGSRLEKMDQANEDCEELCAENVTVAQEAYPKEVEAALKTCATQTSQISTQMGSEMRNISAISAQALQENETGVPVKNAGLVMMWL